jgi:hypothetical protein
MNTRIASLKNNKPSVSSAGQGRRGRLGVAFRSQRFANMATQAASSGFIPPSGISPSNRQSAKPLYPAYTKLGEGQDGGAHMLAIQDFALIAIRLEGRQCVRNESIRTVLDNLKASSQEDIAVQAERPIVDIPKIVRNPLGHLLKATRFAAQSINLRPTGYSGLDVIAKYIFGDQRVIFIVMRKRMWPRSNQRHITL